MKVRPATPLARYAILGYPLEHSVSPLLHNRAFKDYGMRAVYQKLPVSPQEFEREITKIKREDWQGFNVTIPYKERIISFLDWIDETARAIGAVNTIKCKAGRWLGFNTDWLGFLRPLAEDLARIKRCLVLGAGGAARAVTFGLIVKGEMSSLIVANRSLGRAQQLINDLKAHTSIPLQAISLQKVASDKWPPFDLIVNTTSVGMNDEQSRLICDPLPLAHAQTIVYDLVYKPPETAFLRRARSAGLRALNGYPMLVYQADEAFKIWTGNAYKASTLQALLSGKL